MKNYKQRLLDSVIRASIRQNSEKTLKFHKEKSTDSSKWCDVSQINGYDGKITLRIAPGITCITKKCS